MRLRLLLLVLVGVLLAVSSAEAQFTQPGYNTVRDEGVDLVRRRAIDCVGAGIVCADDAVNGVTRVTVTGGGGGGTTGLIGISSGTVISGSVGSLYMAAGTLISQTEAVIEQRVLNGMTVANMTCIASGDPGSGKSITITGRTGACGSMSPSGTFVCSLTGGSGRPVCSTGANTLAISATNCWALGVASSGGAFGTPVSVNCVAERTL